MADGLTPRELEVLQAVADGHTTTEGLAEVLFVSTRTVKNHLHRIYREFGVPDRAAAVLHGLRVGLVELRPAVARGVPVAGASGEHHGGDVEVRPRVEYVRVSEASGSGTGGPVAAELLGQP